MTSLSRPNSVPTASYVQRLSAIFLSLSPEALPPIPSSLQVRLVSDNPDLDRTLRESLDTVTDLDVIAHSAALAEPAAANAGVDILLVDVGNPPRASNKLTKLRAENESALIIILAPQIDDDVRELGDALNACAYLKHDQSLHDIAALVVGLASLCR